MIFGLWHLGSGIGDQTFAYLAARVRAEDLGVPFSMIGEFKGASFMQIDRGQPANLKYHIEQPSGKLIIDEPHKLIELNTPYFNPEFFFIPDGSVIDGYGCQSEQYWGHRLDEINKWLKTDNPSNIEDCCCMCNMRGGEYKGVSELFLPKEYWDKGMDLMTDKHFHIHTDDAEFFHQWYPTLPTIKNIEVNWVALRYAKNAIISNSAFAIIPRLLKHLEDPEAVTIAPFGWNARNASLTEWKGRPGNFYKKFTYI